MTAVIYNLTAFEGLVEMRTEVAQRFEPSDLPKKRLGHRVTAAAFWFSQRHVSSVGGFHCPGPSGWKATPFPPLEGFGSGVGGAAAVAAQGDRNKRKDGLRLHSVVVMMQKLEIRDKMR